ncbi:MAG: GNAT family N-acetyltransferase [Chlamydiia bacterium]|nr:GNAT family N-acetyltransferase [Chlamydiia bacterium]
MAVPNIPQGKPYQGMLEFGVDIEDKNIVAHLYTEDLRLRSVSKNDIVNYQTLFADVNVMKTFATGETWTPDKTEDRVNRWVSRWQNSNPYSAFAIYHKEQDVFIGHCIAGGGEDLHLDTNPNAGYSEMAYAIHQEDQGKTYGKQATAAVVQKFVPWCKEKHYLVSTAAGKEGGARPLEWLTATTLVDNVASTRILTGLGFECKRQEGKFGKQRGIFALKV